MKKAFRWGRTGYEGKMKNVNVKIGLDEFGVQRVYIPIDKVSNGILKELCKVLSFECTDCGFEVEYLCINLQEFIKEKDGRSCQTTMHFDCGTCSIGG